MINELASHFEMFHMAVIVHLMHSFDCCLVLFLFSFDFISIYCCGCIQISFDVEKTGLLSNRRN